MKDEEWIVIEVGPDRRRLRLDAAKLRRGWPGRYDIRITPIDGARRFELAVRHRD